jgi:branched-chain amino acid transport system ATP-binding protein
MGELLDVNSLAAGYGDHLVVREVSFAVAASEIVVLVGSNGAGKSTLCKAIFGLIPIRAGYLSVEGIRLQPHPSSLRAQGVAFVPQGGRVFSSLTVQENLQMGTELFVPRHALSGRISEVLDLFPVLRARLQSPAGRLSGGERQMLTLAMSLTIRPRLLVLDEPTLGLAPQAALDLFGNLKELVEETGLGLLMVEHRVHDVLRIADRILVLRQGTVSFSSRVDALKDVTELWKNYF